MSDSHHHTTMVRHRHDSRRGFTLVEVSIVIVLLSVIVAAAIPYFRPTVEGRLYAAAHIMASDLQYCRSLAVTNNSHYQLKLNVPLNRYELSHAGANSQLDDLPPSAFLVSATGANGKMIQYNAVSAQPGSDAIVRLHEVTRDSLASVPTLEFDGLGALTTPGKTEVWLTAGVGAGQRYIAVGVDYSTGDTKIGEIQRYDAGGGGMGP